MKSLIQPHLILMIYTVITTLTIVLIAVQYTPKCP